MGRDKALLPWKESTFLETIASELDFLDEKYLSVAAAGGSPDRGIPASAAEGGEKDRSSDRGILTSAAEGGEKGSSPDRDSLSADWIRLPDLIHLSAYAGRTHAYDLRGLQKGCRPHPAAADREGRQPPPRPAGSLQGESSTDRGAGSDPDDLKYQHGRGIRQDPLQLSTTKNPFRITGLMPAARKGFLKGIKKRDLKVIIYSGYATAYLCMHLSASHRSYQFTD